MLNTKSYSLLSLTLLFVMLIVPNNYVLHANAETSDNESPLQYTIKKDDTFYLLSVRFNSSISEIFSLNPEIDPFNLRIGSKIKLPVGTGIMTHQVKSGDTLGNIASIYNSNVYTIAERNKIVNPDLIYPGEILAITEVDNQPSKDVSKREIIEIVYDLNQSELNKGALNARYENGWIKMDNINFNLAIFDWSMSIVHKVLDKHNVKIDDYTVENVQWEHPNATNHWGTVCIKVVNK